jgi:hypothetical protein
VHTDFIWQALKETANLLLRAGAFYLAIMAAILSYVFSHPLAPSLRTTALWLVIIVTLLFIVAVGSVSWGLVAGLRNLENAQQMLSPAAFAQLRLSRFFGRARIVFWIVVTASLLIMGLLLGGIVRSLVV